MPAALTFIATCDLVAITRGRSLRTAEYARRLDSGVGWVPADLALTTFGDIADPNPFGSLGDLRLIPIDDARITLPGNATRAETDVVLARLTEPDGTPWACDPRGTLVDALARLDRHGLRLVAAFEQEFGLRGVALEGTGATPAPFSLEAHRLVEPFGTSLVETLAEQGFAPETWLPEYGAGQYELTIAPADALMAADRAILVRALVRDLAAVNGLRVTFAPKIAPEAVGNGVHIHMSLWDGDRPVTLDAGGGLTSAAGAFAAGVMSHAPALVGWTAPSVISPMRFGPHHWSSAASFVGRQNREAMLRICPTPTVGGGDPLRAANLEYRAADATANPWLALAAVVRAGVDGLDRDLPAPSVVEGELEKVDAATRERLGIRDLPPDTEAALRAIETDEEAAGWFAPDLVATHLGIRRTELAILADATPEERCRRYADVL